MKTILFSTMLLFSSITASHACLFELSEKDSIEIEILRNISEEIVSKNQIIYRKDSGILRSGTLIPLVISNDLISKRYLMPIIKVKNDIIDSENNVLIHGGTIVKSELIAVPSKAIGKGGNLSLSITSVLAADGQEIILSGYMQKEGESRTGLLWGLAVGGCFVVTPLSFFILFVKGDNVVIPKGTEIDGSVSKTYNIKVK